MHRQPRASAPNHAKAWAISSIAATLVVREEDAVNVRRELLIPKARR